MEELKERIRELSFELKLTRTIAKSLEKRMQEFQPNNDKISVRALIVIMILSYILFLGERIKDLLSIDLLKIFLP